MSAHVLTTAAGLLMAIPFLLSACFFLLQSAFHYPETLRQPPDAILR